VPQAFDVGAEQRGRVAQPGPGVDNAVVHVVAVGHRGPQGGVVEDVAVVALDVELVDPHGRAGAAQQHSHPFAMFHQLPRDVRAEEAARTHYQFHRAGHAL